MKEVINVAGNIYLLYGADDYCIKEKMKDILDKHQIESEAIEVYDYEESKLEEALQSAMTIPFLTDNKAVILNNLGFLGGGKVSSDSDINSLIAYIERPNPTTLLLLTTSENILDKRKTIVKTLNDTAELINCQKDENEDLYSKIKKILSSEGLSIDANALQQFLSRTSYDRFTMMNELDKLILFSKGKEHISIDMVRDVVTRNLEENIFNLVNAIIAKDQQVLMNTYLDLTSQNIDPTWMIGVIVSKFQEILYTQELLNQKKSFEEIMKYFQASKGRVYYMTKNARETDSQELFEYISKLEKLDYEIKSGRIDKFIGLEMFLYKIFG